MFAQDYFAEVNRRKMTYKPLRDIQERTPFYDLLRQLKDRKEGYAECTARYEEQIAALKRSVTEASDSCLGILANSGTVIGNLRALQTHYANGPLIARHKLEEHYDARTIGNMQDILDTLTLSDKKRLLSRSVVQRGIKSKDVYTESGIAFIREAVGKLIGGGIGVTIGISFPYLNHVWLSDDSFSTKLFLDVAAEVAAFGCLFVPAIPIKEKNFFSKLADQVEERTKYVRENLEGVLK